MSKFTDDVDALAGSVGTGDDPITETQIEAARKELDGLIETFPVWDEAGLLWFYQAHLSSRSKQEGRAERSEGEGVGEI